MYYPSKQEFLKLAKKGNLIPVYDESLADLETPLSAFIKISDGGYSYLLESVEGGEKIARYSFLGANPSLVFKSDGKKDPLSQIKKLMSRYRFVPTKGLPRFSGGMVGYLSYDAVRFFEEIPDKNKDELNLPIACFMMTDTFLVFDHVNHTIKTVVLAQIEKDARRTYDAAVAKIEQIKAKLKKPLKGRIKTKKSGSPLKIESNFTKKAYERIVEKAKEYIKAGDIIQVVPSQRFKTRISVDPLDIYRALRSINPSPYMFYLNLDRIKIVGSSPEVMVRCEDGRIELRPIAGTRPRGKDAKQDRRLEKELLADAKERAEHVMLVDLGRNDVGRVADFKSVNVDELMVIERYSHVMHIVSEVAGKLKKGKDVFDVVRAAFPAGTVSGAPKIRAMEIIDELENTRRGLYAGAIGYFSFSGNIDTCIAIRTILIKGATAYVQAGGGVVADSVPSREYQETVNKARAMIKAIEMAQRGMT
jgi:anthranilate synthase component 1